MDDEACCRALDLLDREVVMVDLSGAVLYANGAARRLIDPPPEGEVEPRAFHALWTERPGEVRALLRRLGGMSTWQPFTLTRAAGAHEGLRIQMRGRAFLPSGDPGQAPRLLLTSDAYRERAFEDHRRLIRHLNVRIGEGSRMEGVLTQLLQTEQRLRQELVHRVKNNLAMLLSLLRMNRQRVESPEAASQLEEMERRILSIAAVHDALDRSHDTDFVRADELIERICSQLENAVAPGRITIRRSLVPVRLHITDATPLALIVNELVTNALKHAFPEDKAGTISIHLKKNGVEKLEAVVQDDGVGLSMPLGAAGRGQGSAILEALADQLQGEIVRTAEQGTTWQLVFAPRSELSSEATMATG